MVDRELVEQESKMVGLEKKVLQKLALPVKVQTSGLGLALSEV